MPLRRPAASAVFVLLAAAVALSGCASEDPPPASAVTSGVDGVQAYDDLSRDHTTDPVDYAQAPPVGGAHDPQWLDCTGTVYGEPVRDENAVHSLEHGAVWVTYDGSVPAADVTSLAAKVDGHPYVFMSPYPGQASPVVLTAWGLQLGVDSIDDSRVDEFLIEYNQGPQTPEPGAPCETGEMS